MGTKNMFFLQRGCDAYGSHSKLLLLPLAAFLGRRSPPMAGILNCCCLLLLAAPWVPLGA